MASSHLMLPVIYNILKKNNYINFLPSELVIYLKNIYNLNESRNTILLKEAKEISEILSNKNIKFVFLKGANYLINNIYDEIGERMVGDIDVLVDCNQAKNAQSALIENGYNALKPKTYIWKKHHLPRLVNNKKLFAVEVHEKILNKIQNDDLNNCGTIDKILEKENEILLKIWYRTIKLMIIVYYDVNIITGLCMTSKKFGIKKISKKKILQNGAIQVSF